MSGPFQRILTAGTRRAGHAGALLACAGASRDFDQSLADVRGAQTGRLSTILRAVAGTAQARRWGLDPTLSPQAFRERVPETSYSDFQAAIEQQRAGKGGQLTRERCRRYQPTSGSSAATKWIPYTGLFLKQLDGAISPWAFDLYRRFPGVRQGQHYWSLSWLPTNLRASAAANVNDDRALLSWSKRLFTALTAPVPAWITTTQTSDDSLFATLCFLAAADDLTLMSVWSPTFALNLFEQLAVQRQAVVEVLDEGRWSAGHQHLPGPAPRSLRAAQLLRAWDGRADAAFFAELWPRLALVSAWDTSTSARWAARLQQLLPQAQFQGKGLWATEGVVTIPYRERYPLALRSHYVEFVDLADDKPYFSWQLRPGQIVRPLLTTGGGLLRYALQDRLRVRDFLAATPCLEFLERIDDVDMVGEKMSPQAARAALDALGSESESESQSANGNGNFNGSAADMRCQPLSLLAVTPARDADKPGYVALCEGSSAAHDQRRGAWLDARLRAVFHYNLARDLGQLAPARVLTTSDARRLYQEIGEARGMVSGNMKLEALLLCDDARSAELIQRRIGGGRHP